MVADRSSISMGPLPQLTAAVGATHALALLDLFASPTSRLSDIYADSLPSTAILGVSPPPICRLPSPVCGDTPTKPPDAILPRHSRPDELTSVFPDSLHLHITAYCILHLYLHLYLHPFLCTSRPWCHFQFRRILISGL